MIQVTFRQLIESNEALVAFGANAKLPTALYIKALRILSAVKPELDNYNTANSALIDAHMNPDILNSEPGRYTSKTAEDGIAFLAEREALLKEEITLQGVSKIAWALVNEALEKQVLGLSPAQIVALDWLIELPAE